MSDTSHLGFAFGIPVGIFVATAIFLVLLAIHAKYVEKKVHACLLFTYGAVATSCFALFQLFVISVHSPDLCFHFPAWLLLFGKVAMPLGIYFNFQMISQSIPIKSLDGYLAWSKIKSLYPYLNTMLVLMFMAVMFFISNPLYVIALVLSVVILNNILSIVLANKALGPHPFNKVHNLLLLSIGCGSALVISLVFTFELSAIPESLFLAFHAVFSILVAVYTFVLIKFIVEESIPYEDISKYNAEGFYKNIYQAINNNDFFIEYQPKVSLKNQKVCGIEALVRWEHPVNGLMPPGDFIPMAERTSIIDNICEWVISQSVKDIKVMRENGLDLPVSINFSVSNIKLSMVDFLVSELRDNNLPMSSIIIEITESLFLDITDEHQLAIDKIHEAGIHLSLDDFGAGHSSVRHLDTMSLSEVKLDRALVDKLNESNQKAVVETLMSLFHHLGIKVVAEGVNDEETTQALLDMNCEMGQGFGICRPKRFDDLMSWIDDNLEVTEFFKSHKS